MIKPAQIRILLILAIIIVVLAATGTLLALGIVAALTGKAPPPVGWVVICSAVATIVFGVKLLWGAFK